MLKEIFFVSVIAMGLISGCGGNGEPSLAQVEEAKKLPEGKKLSELSPDDAEKAVKLMGKSLQVMVNDDVAKLLDIDPSDPEKKNFFRPIKELIGDEARLKSALANIIPLDLAQACVFYDIGIKIVLNNEGKLKETMKDQVEFAKLMQEIEAKQRTDAMKYLKIDNDRLAQIQKISQEIIGILKVSAGK